MSMHEAVLGSYRTINLIQTQEPAQQHKNPPVKVCTGAPARSICHSSGVHRPVLV